MAIHKSFDNLAKCYAILEQLVFGKTLETVRFHHLPCLENRARILILGEGDGRFAQRLRALLPQANIVIVDKSPAMLARARQRLEATTRPQQWPLTQFVEGDALQLFEQHAVEAVQGPFDAVVTAFFLDCFEATTLQRLLPQITARLAPSALWLYADFRVPPEGGWSKTGSLLTRFLYWAFSLITDIEARTLHDPLPLLIELGLTQQQRRDFAKGLLTSVVLTGHPKKYPTARAAH